MGLTMVEKILARAAGRDTVTPGDIVTVDVGTVVVIDQNFMHNRMREPKKVFDPDKIVIMQASNTGLTEGSTPKGGYDRDVVLINVSRMNALHLLQDGQQVLSLPGASLFELEKKVRQSGSTPTSVYG